MPTDFDTSGKTPFGPDYVEGQSLKWSDILKFPSDAGSARFDGDGYKPVEVTLSDSSIFQTQRASPCRAAVPGRQQQRQPRHDGH